MKKIQEIFNKLRNSMGVDFEGDCTYRVHIKTAERLATEAYKIGVDEYHDQLIFVGYTNGRQIYYAASLENGAFYPDTEENCMIPLYMLKTHWHRLESTSDGEVTLEMIKEVWSNKNDT